MRFDDVDKQFGANLKKRRKQLHISQEELGTKVELSRVSISNIEKGVHGISLELLYRFAEHLNTSPSELMPIYQIDPFKNLSKSTKLFVEGFLNEETNREIQNA